MNQSLLHEQIDLPWYNRYFLDIIFGNDIYIYILGNEKFSFLPQKYILSKFILLSFYKITYNRKEIRLSLSKIFV